MRILWLSHRDAAHPLAGGAEIHLEATVEGLARLGHEVTVLVEKHGQARTAETLNGVRYIRFGTRVTLHMASPIYELRHAHDFDIVVDDLAHAVPFCSPIFTSHPVVAWVHHVHQPVLGRELSPFMAQGIRLAEKSIPAIYDNIVAISEATRRDLIAQLRVPSRSIQVIPYGLDHSKFTPGLRFENPTVLWMGGFKAYKNPDHVIEAFALLRRELSNARLILAGKGQKEASLRAMVNRLGLSDAVTFTGWVSGTQKLRLLQGAWCLVYSSDIEGWGMGITEAGACGTPAVAYSVGAIPEAIVDGVSGLLVRPHDVTDLARKLLRILRDSDTRGALGRGAFDWAARFDWDKSVKLTDSYFRSLV